MLRWPEGHDDARYTGLRCPPECRGLTARAATVVAPSTWMESFGLAVVEAMAPTVPVVTAAHGTLVEFVHVPVTGLLQRPGDVASLAEHLRQVLDDGERNHQLGATAHHCYEARFTREVRLAALVAGYGAAIAGRLCESI
ncbi:MAG: glycosyltransferase [Actinomycetota bacterium]|nr:glycosyltransferase [Actinomycetota bacterium]